MSELRKKRRNIQTTDLSPVTVAHLKTSLGKTKKTEVKLLRVLFDSGCTATLINNTFCKKLRVTNDRSLTWETKAGTFETNGKCKLQFALPEFYKDRIVEHKAYIDTSAMKNSRYDMIIGRDLMIELGIDILFSESAIKWDTAYVPLKNPEDIQGDKLESLNTKIYEVNQVQTEMDRIKTILDAKYQPANLQEVAEKTPGLNAEQQMELYLLLKKYESLFDGTLGTWKTDPIDIELKEGAKPYHAKPWPVPHIHLATLKLEIDRLIELGVLKKVNNSEWGAPTFIIPKKDGTVRFLTDFRELNRRILRKPFPIPKIQDMLLNLEGFQYATSLDLNMGYYHIMLTPGAQKLCTLVTPWGKYSYRKLPMGLCNSPDIFQEKTSELMAGLEYAQAYLDDILVTTKSSFKDHLEKLDSVLSRPEQAGLKVNAAKSMFAQEGLEYLGFWVSRQGIQPLQSKVQAMLDIAPPTNRKGVRRFIGLINFYRDMWIRRSHVLTPLTKLTSNKVKFRWTEEEQKAFDTIKCIIAKETLLSYPDFNDVFHIYTDASATQLGAVIVQKDKPIAFYSRKLQDAQTKYTTTERELLSIVETLKEFRNILLGQRLVVHTDHKNLTYKTFNTDRVIRWRLIIEEYNPTFEYIPGEKNIVADLLSRLDIQDDVDNLYMEMMSMEPTCAAHLMAALNTETTTPTGPPTTQLLAELYGQEPEDERT